MFSKELQEDIDELLKLGERIKLNLPKVIRQSEQLVCDYCKGKGRKYVGVTLGHTKCPVCGKH